MIPYTPHPLGDNGLLLQFNSVNESDLLNYIHSLTAQLLDIGLDGVMDIIPAFTSVAIFYDPIYYRYRDILLELEPYIHNTTQDTKNKSKFLSIPVCYDEAFGLDLKEIADQHSISVADFILNHTKPTYSVAIMGFLPGFPYLVGLEKSLWTPRKSTPRTHVPKGAVAIGGSYTGIYPIPSPGGWNIIGQTPLSLFDSQNKDPFLLLPGDRVEFHSITKEEFLDWRQNDETD